MAISVRRGREFTMESLDDLVKKANHAPMVLSNGLGMAQVKGVGEVEISLALSAGEEGVVQPMDLIFTVEGKEGAYIVPMAGIFERVLSYLGTEEESDG